MNEEQLNRRLKRMTRLVIIIGFLLLITGALFAMFLLSTMKEAALDQMKSETNEYTKRLYDQIDTDYQIINTFASIVGASELSEDPEFPEMLDEANDKNDFLTMIYTDLDRQAVVVTKNKEITKAISVDDVQPEIQDVLEEALNGRSVVSQFFQGEFSNEAVFIYGTPVYKDGQVCGAVAASDKVEIFNDILDGEGVLGGYGYINMINTNGDYIVHSEKDQIGKELENVFSEPYFNTYKVDAARQKLKETGSLSFSFQYERNRYEAIIRQVGINDWCLLSVGNVHTSSRQVYLLVRIIGIVFAGILILVLFLLVYGCGLMKKNTRELKEIAYHDSLTGAYNLIGFRKKVADQIETDCNYSIIALNVHQFRFINEIFGKEQGDRIICMISQVIQHYLLNGDVLCRENADIFYVYTKETDKNVIEQRCKKIMRNVTGSLDEGHGDYEILMYCGATVNKAEESGSYSLDEMMNHVLAALKRAKDVHQNNIWFFDKELHRKEVMENYVETHMNQAVRDREFHLFLQPKVDLQSGKVSGAEALVRWIKADGEMIYPDQFIPLFESNGFCVRLDMYMVEMVCRQIRKWKDMGVEPLPVSVNQSKRVIYEKDYLRELLDLVDKYQVPTELITLEILEGLALENVDEINRKIEGLQKKGFRVSLDDFGTEYSSFSTFSKLQVDELKLDRWFLKDMAREKNVKIQFIMEEITEIAHKLNIAIVVEGVETEADHRLVKNMKCDFGQGYYYSKPVEAGDFTKIYLASEKPKVLI